MTCLRCSADMVEGFYCTHCGNVPPKSVFSLPYDFRTNSEKAQDEHFYDFKDGLNVDCECGLCQYWREQEARDYENV